MISDSRGFFSVDALFALLLLVAVSTMLINVAHESRESAESIVRVHEQDMTAEKLAAAINTVYANGSRFEMRLDLPDNMIGENYTIYLDHDNRTIFVENSKGILSGLIAKASIIPLNLQDFVLGPDNLKGTIRVYWEDNMIRVKSCG